MPSSFVGSGVVSGAVVSVATVSEVESSGIVAEVAVVAAVVASLFFADFLLIAVTIQTKATRRTIKTVAIIATVFPSARSCAVMVLLGLPPDGLGDFAGI